MQKTITFISAIFLLQACTASSTKQSNTPNVTSNPSGAVVYANGLEIGKTPLQRNLYDEFPTGWQGTIYTAQGVLTMKMDDCKDFALKINDRILSEPIHADLECSEASSTEKSAPVAVPQEGTEARLRKLEALYKKGLITKEEYKKTRERILSEL